MNPITLVLALHNHQPVGNFDWVNEAAVENAYLPFLEVMKDFPKIPYCLHVSGSLLEWAERKKPAYVEALKREAASGRMELIGGGRFEPILPMLTERDRIGQIRSYSEHLKDMFGLDVKGSWLSERVYEQSLVSSLAKAGMSYTVVDDYHLKRAGMRDLLRHFITEDQGRQLFLFPSSEVLRYSIPFAEAEKVIRVLKEAAESRENPLIVYADDGEKFGVWPGTQKHVYQDGWLRKFLGLLEENSDWIRIKTFSNVLEGGHDPGLVFVPDSSYREMVEWSMPVAALEEFRRLEEDARRAGLLDRFRPFTGGGFWRNFRVKYTEANRLYSRMMEVSEEIHRGGREFPGREEALLDLYRGQVNCVYWHGVFGGLYLPHLRLAAYRHLIGAENIARKASDRQASQVSMRSFDFDFDGKPEVAMENGLIKAYFNPFAGGHLFELDMLEKQFNPLMTMTRRKEDYHREIPPDDADDKGIQSIHNIHRSKQKGIREKLAYDRHDRGCLVDHFFGPGLTLEKLAAASYDETGDFDSKPFGMEMAGSARKAELSLFRKGEVTSGGRAVGLSLVKRISMAAGEAKLRISYAILADEDVETSFGPEFNFAMLAGDTDDRYYFAPSGGRIGLLGFAGILPDCSAVGLCDEWMKVKIRVELSSPADLYLYPVQTVSQSEAGFELLYQQSCVTPVWKLALAAGKMREIGISLEFESEGGFPEA